MDKAKNRQTSQTAKATSMKPTSAVMMQPWGGFMRMI